MLHYNIIASSISVIYDSFLTNSAQELHHSNNPLYGSDRYNYNDYEPENLLKPTDEYAYINRRPPVPVPSEQITPYHTIVTSELNQVDNRFKH